MADDTAVSTPAPTPEARITAAIHTWRDEVIAGGPIARATECWNHLEQSLQHLASAIIAVARRMLGIILAMLKSGKEWDPSYAA